MGKTTSILLAILTAGLAPAPHASASAAQVFRGAATKAVTAGVSSAGQGLNAVAIPPQSITSLSLAASAAVPANLTAVAASPAANAPLAQAQAVSDLSQAQSILPPSESDSASPLPEAVQSDSGKLFDSSVKGKTLLLVGTLDSRPWILEEAKRTANQLGLRLMLLDKGEKRHLSKELIPDADFIDADIWAHDPKVMAGVADKVATAAAHHRIDAVYTFLNPFVELAGLVRDRIGAIGNTAASTAAAHTKSIARKIIAEKLPAYATPYAVVKTAAEARTAFNDIRAQMGRDVKVVMKPIHGGGSQGVKVDIASPEEAAAAYAEIDSFLLEFQKRPDAGFEMLDTHPGIMMELMLEGPEVDVEIGKHKDKLLWGKVLDNAPMDRPNAVEKNLAAPSQLLWDAQWALIEAASKMVSVLGLEFGNFHVEMMMTPEGPRLLEVNARMGGATVAKVVRRVYGLNLIESGIRALFGLEIDPGHEHEVFLECRFIIPQVTGTIEAIEGLEEARTLAGVEELPFFKKVGDRQIAAPEDTFDYIGYIHGAGKDYPETIGRTLAALKKIRIKVRKADGTLVEQGADFSHTPVDM